MKESQKLIKTYEMEQIYIIYRILTPKSEATECTIVIEKQVITLFN